jgi:hypothetical protein
LLDSDWLFSPDSEWRLSPDSNTSLVGLKYDGDISGLTADGSAEITYPSGNTYSGQVTKGKRNGTGKFVWNKKNGKSEKAFWTEKQTTDAIGYKLTKGEYQVFPNIKSDENSASVTIKLQ